MKNDSKIRRLMIEETKNLLEEQGKITIKDIAERCYVNIASVNYYFGSKENLIFIVLSEVITDIKTDVMNLIEQYKNKDIEFLLGQFIDLIYTFSTEHIGMLHYLFFSSGINEGQLAEFIRSFFIDPVFVNMVYKNLGRQLKSEDRKLLEVKYVILFSSFLMPLFIQILNPIAYAGEQMETFKDEAFKKHFINQMLKILI
ncbi:TetR/AcrR family transcriptional regulator [Mycoplasmatota bacterium]|nr:TetR/AcrR family transcriptional regulator [Mycoplasmatota bacterium]